MSNQVQKEDFPILKVKVNNKELVYLDNSATTQKPQQVIDALSKYYQEQNSNTHRSVHELADRATTCYENARATVAKFINSKTNEIIFTSGTTDSLNKLSRSLKHNLTKGDEIILSEMEHHSNLVPWQQIAKETGAKINWIPITEDGRLDLTKIPNLITNRTKILSITHVSNVLGTVNPVKEIIEQAKEINKDIICVVDAAQSVPHMQVDVKNLNCDFLAFSGHKMLAPTGIGVLFGKTSLLKEILPNQFGGGMILNVTKEDSTWNEIPYKFEAGTPNIAGAVGLAAAIKYLNKIGMQKIEERMHELTEYGINQLTKISDLTLLGPSNSNNRAPVFSFTIKGIHPHDISEITNRYAVAVRGGNHCAKPLFKKLNTNSATRASCYIYNTKEDIDQLVIAIKEAQKIFGVNE